jgi:hypothetical protein
MYSPRPIRTTAWTGSSRPAEIAELAELAVTMSRNSAPTQGREYTRIWMWTRSSEWATAPRP